MLHYETGDLFDPAFNFDAIAHGCNRQGVMGGGIAAEMKRRYPEMESEYKVLCRNWKDRYFRLGDFMRWNIPGGDPGPLVIYNLATQGVPGADARLNAIRVAFANMVADAEKRGLVNIGIPRIGAGIGGLKWTDVALAMEDGINSTVWRGWITVVTRPQDLAQFGMAA